MEGIYWLRLGGIMALLFGSIYVLLPTVFQEDLESRLETAAGEVDTTEAAGPDLDMAFEVRGGDGDALADALNVRLDAASISTTGVAYDGDVIVVDLGPGADRADIARLASRRGARALFAVPLPEGEAPAAVDLSGLPAGVTAWLGTLPAPQQAAWSDALRGAARTDVGAEQVALDASITKVQPAEGGVLRAKLSAPLGDGVPAALVAIDDTITGVVFPGEGGLLFEELTREVGGTTLSDPDARALLVSGPLPGQLEEAPEVEAAEATDDAAGADEVATSMVPEWVLGMLPDTSMNLGLDLQGGIDLTLQVDLQEAVLGQVARDTTFLADRAAKEGLTLQAQPVHGQPQIEVSSDATLADVTAFLRQEFQSDYIYSESDGAIHIYEMAATRQKGVEDQSIEQVLETLRKRVDETGVKEPSIVKKGGGRINVQLPGMVDVKSAVDAIGTTAILEFRMVDEEFDDAVLQEIISKAADALPEDQFLDDELLNVWLWDRNQALLDRDRIILWEYDEDAEGERRLRALPLLNKVLLTGNDVNDAGVGWDQNQIPYVSMEFKPRGGQVFCDVTGEAVGKRFAIVLDDKIMSAPSIRERICGGAARIEMSSSAEPMKDAKTLALVLRTGALDAPVVVASVRHVGATLGADSIRSGSLAAGIGSAVVLVFMALWYRSAGLIADFALVVNILLVLGCLALFGATLTLPGIAGIALTAGMAVDANIIIYERIREELRLGVHPRKAVDVGFDKAIVAVLDANITTAIAGIVLFSYGTGPIKGFAVTLLIGIITTLVSALFVTRTLMELVTRSSAARLRI